MLPSGRMSAWPCIWQSTPRTADVTVTEIAGYVRVRILIESVIFFRIFGIHSFYATATLLNVWIYMRTDAADGGCGGGLDFAPSLVVSRVSRMFGSFSQCTVLDGNKFSAD